MIYTGYRLVSLKNTISQSSNTYMYSGNDNAHLPAHMLLIVVYRTTVFTLSAMISIPIALSLFVSSVRSYCEKIICLNDVCCCVIKFVVPSLFPEIVTYMERYIV